MTSHLYVHCICTPKSGISNGSCLALATWTWPFHRNDQSTRLDLIWMWLNKYILTPFSILILTLWKWFPCHVTYILYFHIFYLHTRSRPFNLRCHISSLFFIFWELLIKYTTRKTKDAYTRVPSYLNKPFSQPKKHTISTKVKHFV